MKFVKGQEVKEGKYRSEFSHYLSVGEYYPSSGTQLDCVILNGGIAIMVDSTKLTIPKPKKPSGRAIQVSRVNLSNSFRPEWKAAGWTKAQTTRIRKESIAVLRAAKAHNLI